MSCKTVCYIFLLKFPKKIGNLYSLYILKTMILVKNINKCFIK